MYPASCWRIALRALDDDPHVKRQVALKIIKAGRCDDSALVRFDLERFQSSGIRHA
jgi:hypothetical protein